MYYIKDGILYHDHKKTFVLGQSYYPSFHPCKFPVPPSGDREGEMKKDIAMMAKMGFNHIRFAALGDVSYLAEERRVTAQTPFVCQMIEEAEKNGISTSVRLQGFSVNLRGYTDADMISEKGEVPDFVWADFVRTTLCHDGILEDNFVYSRDLAKHFAKHPSVVAYQIYNEPKFPQTKRYITDYNPHTVAKFREWLVARGELSAVSAKAYMPPRSRGEQSPHMWALWRVFSAENMRNFLGNSARGAAAGAGLPTYTCHTADAFCKANPRKGVDVFGNAEDMDIVGYTIYKHAWGAEYYPMCLDGDTFQCAAEVNGKQAWCVELDSRTYIPSSVYNKGTYATIGAGVKGIIYYQWRGDCPVEGVPHPNSCELLNYDGTKTANFDNAAAVNRFIMSVNDLIVNARRAREGIGLFYSAYAIAYCDALENGGKESDKTFFNTASVYYHALYSDLRKTGYTVTILNKEALVRDPLGVTVLIVPDMTHITNEEREAIEAFCREGGTVYTCHSPEHPAVARPTLFKYEKIERTYEESVFVPPYTPYDLPELTGIVPLAVSLDPSVGVQVLEGQGYKLLVVTNTSPIKPRVDVSVRVSVPFASASFVAIDGEREVVQEGEVLTVKGVSDGGMIVLKE